MVIYKGVAIRITNGQYCPTDMLKWVLNQLLTKKSKMLINKCFFIKETEDKAGEKVEPHYHGYISYGGVSEPTFRKIFKRQVLGIKPYTKQVRGNKLYSISKIRKSYIVYLAYMLKNVELLDYMCQDEYDEHEALSQHFSYDEYLKIQKEKSQFKYEKKSKTLELKENLEALKKEFMNSDNRKWTFSKEKKDINGNCIPCLVKKYIELYVEADKPFRVF